MRREQHVKDTLVNEAINNAHTATRIGNVSRIRDNNNWNNMYDRQQTCERKREKKARVHWLGIQDSVLGEQLGVTSLLRPKRQIGGTRGIWNRGRFR